MATYVTNLTTFWLESATTVTAIGTGGAGLGNPETDFFIQGSDCISKGAWTNAIKGFIIDALGTTFTVPTDGAVIFYAKYDAAGSLDLKVNGGFQCIIGSADGDYYHFYIGGKNTLAFSSWESYALDPNTATEDTQTGTPSGAERWVGILADLPTTNGPTKGNPIAIDAIRYGRCDLEYTSTGCTFNGAESWANDPTRRWGLLELRKGAYLMQGFHSFGTGAAPCTFNDSNKAIFILPTGANNLTNDAVSTAFNRLEILNASSSITWNNIAFTALGTRARGVFVHTAGTVALTNCQFTGMDTFLLLSGSSILNTIWRGCNAVTAPASTLNGSSILESTVAAGEGALVYNSATDPDGKLDNMVFSQGAAAHSAIEFGTLVTSSITLRGIDFTGFGGTDDVNGAVFKFLATSGSLNLNLIGCTVDDSFSVDDSAGITVTVVIDPVTTLVNVKDNDGANLSGARVLLEASNGAGDFPFQDSITITRVSTTASVAHTAHGMKDGDIAVIRGADQPEYNGPHAITNVTTNAYDYTVSGAPDTPATGTITCTGAIISDTTDGSGNASTSRTFTLATPVTGRIRKSSASPRFKDFAIAGTISTTTGLTINVRMIIDE